MLATGFPMEHTAVRSSEGCVETTLARANRLFREGRYEEALQAYEAAMAERPEMAYLIRFNMALAEKRKSRVANTEAHDHDVTNAHQVQIEAITEASKGAAEQCAPGDSSELTKPEGLDDYTFERIKESGLFDAVWYREQYGYLLAPGENPLAHYLAHGVEEGLNPSPGFNTRYYLENNPDVAEAGVNPFLHYVLYGREEGRHPLPALEEDQFGYIEVYRSPDGCKIPLENWSELAKSVRIHTESPEVAVIIPVYRDRSLTWRCLISVLTELCNTPFVVIVIDDASPEPELSADLNEIAHRGWIKLLRNERNLGFVKTVNRGIEAAGKLDVILLNSDTEVYAGWIDRLRKAAYRHLRTASVTPLSNNATIASYPIFLRDNPDPLEISYAELDRLISKVNDGNTVMAPTGHGFCLYLRRDALDDVGLFDDLTFGRGYGEENDWCQRAQKKGYLNFIATDTFVRHFGSISFRGEKEERIKTAMNLIEQKHTDYHVQIQSFIKQDPLFPYRQSIDWARIQYQVRDENVLIMCHRRGGGTERHVRETAQSYLSSKKGVFYLIPSLRKRGHLRIVHPHCRNLPNLEEFDAKNIFLLTKALSSLRITEVHVHSFLDFERSFIQSLPFLVRTIGAKLVLEIHDYHVICPHINLADEHGFYCGEPDEAGCNACLKKRDNGFETREIRAWRSEHYLLLQAASEIFVPNEDVANRLSRYFPGIEFKVDPHEKIDWIKPRILQVRKGEGPLHIVIIGALSKIKGYDVLLACAQEVQEKKLPIRFSLLGYSCDDVRLKKAGVIITGRYKDSEALERLYLLKPDLVWLPSTWPETYSYTLSIALQAGYPCYVFDIGAQASRLKSLGMKEWVIPLSWAKETSKVLQLFLNILNKR
jgi:GT2 family glycosyltransferase/glycosyltransferase involved in cell wall biosynthesis